MNDFFQIGFELRVELSDIKTQSIHQGKVNSVSCEGSCDLALTQIQNLLF